MIKVLICSCGGADVRARNFLKEHGVENWLNVEMVKGLEPSRQFIKTIAPRPQGPDSPEAVAEFLKHSGSFIIFLGYNDDYFMWSNIFQNNAAALVDAAIICEKFA